MKKALVDSGSSADFIALIGFSEPGDKSIYDGDMDLLRSNGIIVHFLPRFQDESKALNFAEMALLKITPWSFVEYERVQFFDGDVCKSFTAFQIFHYLNCHLFFIYR